MATDLGTCSWRFDGTVWTAQNHCKNGGICAQALPAKAGSISLDDAVFRPFAESQGVEPPPVTTGVAIDPIDVPCVAPTPTTGTGGTTSG